MKYAIIALLLLGLTGCGCGTEEPKQSQGLIERDTPEGEEGPDDGIPYWNNWTELYKCDEDQFKQMSAEVDICLKTSYKKDYCFANAKKLYCDKIEVE